MSKGRIDATLTAEVVSQCLALLGQLDQQLPFLLRVKTSEKNRLPKPRAGGYAVMQTIVELQTEAGIPPAADDSMLADMSVYNGLTTIKDRLEALARRIEDTHLVAGSEAWNESLIRYGMLRQLERSKPELKVGLDRIQPLITSRSRRPAPAPVEDEPETPAPTEPDPAK
jgi:hypothetical protein